MRRILLLLGILVVFPVSPGPAHAADGLAVRGRALRPDGSAHVSGRVFLFKVLDGQTRVDFEDQRIANPGGEIDAQGFFEIQTPSDYLTPGQDFTVGVGPYTTASAPQMVAGEPPTFVLAQHHVDSAVFDAGELTIEAR